VQVLGVFGGSFDPVHFGHLAIARAAREQLSLQSIRWVPTGLPGHRNAPVASTADRLAMLRIALANDDRNEIDSDELLLAARGIPTYTVNTLSRLRGQIGNSACVALIIGSDQLHALDTWRDWLRLFDLAHVAVAERPGHAVDPLRLPDAIAAQWKLRQGPSITGAPCGRIVRFAMPPVDVSSTAIRQSIARGLGAGHLLPEDVVAYIQSHGLYAEA
jgi:nicotinate-nucleotide adenylyltransferase